MRMLTKIGLYLPCNGRSFTAPPPTSTTYLRHPPPPPTSTTHLNYPPQPPTSTTHLHYPPLLRTGIAPLHTTCACKNNCLLLVPFISEICTLNYYVIYWYNLLLLTDELCQLNIQCNVLSHCSFL